LSIHEWLLSLRQKYADLNEEQIRLEKEKPLLWEARVKAIEREKKAHEIKLDIAKHLSFIAKNTTRGTVNLSGEFGTFEFTWQENSE
jgi:phage anti-repressor protein